MSDFTHLFPNAKLSTTPSNSSEHISLAQANGLWLILETSDLSDREQYILSLINQADQAHQVASPWLSYLFHDQGVIPQTCQRIQWIHMHIQQADHDLIEDWIEVVSQFFPNLMTNLHLGESDFVFILNQDTLFKAEDILNELLPSLEFDFGMKISAFIGQIWPNSLEKDWPLLFKKEQELFQTFLNKINSQNLIRFSQMLISQVIHPASTTIYKALAQLISHQEEMLDTIKALWKTQAVLTKTALYLYIHRNTLQYRLDKFHEQTGLSLKNMDDLAIAYLAIHNH